MKTTIKYLDEGKDLYQKFESIWSVRFKSYNHRIECEQIPPAIVCGILVFCGWLVSLYMLPPEKVQEAGGWVLQIIISIIFAVALAVCAYFLICARVSLRGYDNEMKNCFLEDFDDVQKQQFVEWARGFNVTPELLLTDELSGEQRRIARFKEFVLQMSV